tara:strand:- start:6 stop:209 length:204 start_codon:yes stop_codon:yes gene_type:complete
MGCSLKGEIMKRSKKWIQEQAIKISQIIIEDNKWEYIPNSLYEETQETQDAVSEEMHLLRIKPRIIK